MRQPANTPSHRPPPIPAQVLLDARQIVTQPELAARVPASLRRMAWAALKSERGQTTRQRPHGTPPAIGGAA